MEEVYKKILLEPSHWDEETKSFKINSNDIIEGFKKIGYKEYCFGGFSYVFTKNELSQKEIDRYEAEAQSALAEVSNNIAKEVNKRIIDEMKRKGLI